MQRKAASSSNDAKDGLGGSKALKAPVGRFKSKKGRSFTVRAGQHSERFPFDSRWSDSWPIFYNGKEAGTLFRNLNYGTGAGGQPRWQASTRKLYWTYAADAPTGPGRGIGFDVAAFDTAKECLLAWGHSADQILDYAEGKGRLKKSVPRRRR